MLRASRVSGTHPRLTTLGVRLMLRFGRSSCASGTLLTLCFGHWSRSHTSGAGPHLSSGRVLRAPVMIMYFGC
ncbi:hypothetical protein C8F01DRAFT_1158083 [Mycena amicta]|nr:hypothetical protein C8F01DRAFT_1158083 [Mycena amicta]